MNFMRAWQLDDSAATPALFMTDIPAPRPGRGQVLIRVHAAGVTKPELTWQPTTQTKTGEKRHHAIPSHEFSGTVAALGAGVAGISVGLDVFGMNDWYADGATAEFCLTRPEWIAPKPARLSHAEAASVPISALTAQQGLFDRAKLQPGEHVLIHGGSGGVGVYAIQLARRRGANIITTASAGNREFLLQLGAGRVIDYHTERFEQAARNMDVIFDTVGGSTLEQSWKLLSPHGRLVTIASAGANAPDDRTRNAFFIVEPKRSQLEEIANLLTAGEIVPVVDAVVPFESAAAVYAGGVPNRAGRGKVVVEVAG